MGVQLNGSTGNVIATRGTFSGNVGIAGTLTYEDVTDIDAVGLVTARSGIEIGASPGVGASISRQGNAIFSGITTIGSKEVGAGITLSPDGDVFFTGIITGNGSGLTNLATDLVNDTTPQLGGDLDTNDNHILLDQNHYLYFVTNGGSSFLGKTASGLYLQNNGDLHLRGDDVYIRGDDDSKMGKFIEGGAVELYHNASKKLETTSGGVTVTGTLTATAYSGITTAATSDFVQVSRYTVPGEVSQVDIDFDNTNYTHFKLFVTGQNIAYDANIYCRFKLSGSYQTGNNYYSGTLKKYAGGWDESEYGGANQSYGYLTNNVGADNTSERWQLIGDINTGGTSARGFMSFNTFYTDNNTAMANNFGVVGYMQYGLLQGIRIYASSGNLESGAVYTLYGLK